MEVTPENFHVDALIIEIAFQLTQKNNMGSFIQYLEENKTHFEPRFANLFKNSIIKHYRHIEESKKYLRDVLSLLIRSGNIDLNLEEIARFKVEIDQIVNLSNITSFLTTLKHRTIDVSLLLVIGIAKDIIYKYHILYLYFVHVHANVLDF